jgi:Zn-dependent peptidase ImmA (M78 family)
MTSLIDLYQLAERNGHAVYWYSCADDRIVSMSVMDDDGDCAIAIDPYKIPTIAAEKSIVAHELGHCETGSFYNQYATCDIRQRHENRADRWAIHTLVPKEELNTAVQAGYTNLWELAEYFDVTEDFMKKAICLYQYGNLAMVG